jgi:hypothetical protein
MQGPIGHLAVLANARWAGMFFCWVGWGHTNSHAKSNTAAAKRPAPRQPRSWIVKNRKGVCKRKKSIFYIVTSFKRSCFLDD